MRANLWNKSVPRVELDQRARDARLRFERIERLLVPRAAVTASWLGRIFCLFSFAGYGAGPRGRRIGGPLSNRRPSCMPQTHQAWSEVTDSFCGALGLPLHHSSAESNRRPMTQPTRGLPKWAQACRMMYSISPTAAP
jgi:hypothetical protein